MNPNKKRSIISWMSFFLLFVTFHPTQQKRDYYFHLDSCDVDSSSSKVCESNCTLTKKGDITGVSVYYTLLTEGESGGMSVEILGRGLNGETLMPLMPGQSRGKSSEKGYGALLNITVPDLCIYIKGTKRSNLVEIGMDELRKSGKFPDCPAQKGTYYIKDFYLSPEYFPPILPEGDFINKGAFFGVKDGVRHECTRWRITGSVRFKKDSLWGRMKHPK